MSQAPSQPKEGVSDRRIRADFHLNQHVFRTLAYTATGFGLGIVGSLFFKHKAAMTAFFAGNGMGYGLAGFGNELQGFRSYRSFGQNQGGNNKAGRDVEDLAAKAKDFAQEKGQQALQGAKNLAGDAKNQAGKVEQGAKDLANNAKETLNNAKDAAKNQAGKVEQGAKDLANNAKETLNNAKDAAKNQAGKAEQGAKDLANNAKEAANNAKDAAKNQAGKAEQGAKDLANNAKEAVNNAKDAAKNQAGKVEQGAKDLANNAKEAVKNQAGKAEQGAKDLVEKAKDATHDAAHNKGASHQSHFQHAQQPHRGSGEPNNIHNKPDEKIQHESDRNRQGIARVDVGESKDPSHAGHHDNNPSLRHSGAGKTSNLNKGGPPVPTQGRHDEDGKKANPSITDSAASVGYRPPVNKSA